MCDDMSTHRLFFVRIPDARRSQRGQEKSVGTVPERTNKYEIMEGRTIEKDIRSNTITNDNLREEADSTAEKEQNMRRVTQPEARKPSAIKLPIGFFDSDKVRILYGQKNGANVVLLYIMLVDFAAKSNRNGALYVADGIPYDAEVIANLTRMDTAVVKSALDSLQRFGLIRVNDDAIFVVGYAQLVHYEQSRKRHK